MKKLLLALAICLCASPVWAQCNGVFPAQTLCGNFGPSPAPPHAISSITSVYGPSTTTSGFIPNWIGTVGQQLGSQNTITTSQNIIDAGNILFTGQTSLYTTYLSTVYNSANLITLPLSGTIPALGQLQTFTNNNTFTGQTSLFSAKITSGLITSLTSALTVPSGGTGVATIPAHAAILGEGTASTSNTGVGSVGQCLVGEGASADPTFVNGCRVLLNTFTIATSTTNITDTTHITSAYNDYEIVFENVVPVITNTTCEIQTMFNGSAMTSNYLTSVVANISLSSALTTGIPCSYVGDVTNTQGFSGFCRMYSPLSLNGTQKIARCFVDYDAAGAWVAVSGGGANTAVTQPVSGFVIQFSSGSILSGVVKLYGLE